MVSSVNTNASNPKGSAGQNSELNPKQMDMICFLDGLCEGLADNHVEKNQKASGSDFKRLEKLELAKSHGKYIWLTPKGLKVAESLRGRATTTDEVVSSINAVEKSKEPKRLAKQIPEGEGLNWAYRRLRRQAYLYFGQNLKRDGFDGNLKILREELESVPESYKMLRQVCERLVENDSKIHGDWESFMETFFAHVIHPGSQSAK